MPTRRYFANQAPQQTLNASITSGSTSCVVNGSFSGWPTQFPFYASLDFGTASAEVVSVTNIVGTTATISRGQNGTAAVSHAAGATLDHVMVAADLDEANAHTSASSGVHGISGNVVGHNDVQTLSNKTLAAPILTGTATGASATFSGTVQQATSTTTGNATVGGNQTVSGTETITGASQAASYTASGNGAVSGVIVPKSYTNEAAATTALGTPVVGTMVWLTAPSTTGQVAGIFYWNGSAWAPGIFRQPLFTGSGATLPGTVATATFTAIPIDTEVIDTHNGHDNVTNNTRYTPNVAGYYKITANCGWAANGTGRRITSIWLNGAEIGASRSEGTPSATAGSAQSVISTWIAQANGTTDFFEAKGFQSSGGNLAMTFGTLMVEWLRP